MPSPMLTGQRVARQAVSALTLTLTLAFNPGLNLSSNPGPN